ncbi:MAG TPA: hypothetical protein PKD54_10805 [Pirellulaceae bacterium]|nr:hypothetical protein [Pirellulaceae bacterium]
MSNLVPLPIEAIGSDAQTGESFVDNPFATCYIRPRSIEYRFRPGESIDLLIARLDHSGWRGQIIGPHGSGKSTLVATLAGPALTRFERIEWWAIRSHSGVFRRVVWHRENDLRRDANADGHVEATRLGTLTVIEGWERLPWWSRLASCLAGRLGRRHVLLTGRRPMSCFAPVIYRATPDLARFMELCHWLQRDVEHPLADSDVSQAFHAHQGNAREALLALFDLFQEQNRS